MEKSDTMETTYKSTENTANSIISVRIAAEMLELSDFVILVRMADINKILGGR